MRNRQRRRRGTAFVLSGTAVVALLALPAIGGAIDPDPSTQRVSVDAGTGGGRELPSMTPDGDRIVFVGRGEGNQGVWLRDLSDGATYRITNGNHFNPSISDDGSTVAYVIYGTNRQVYVRDISDPTSPGAQELASAAANNQAGNGISDYPNLSGDGRFVAFQSTASNLTPDTPLPTSGGPNKVYVKDMTSGAIEMVSVDDTGAAQPGNGVKPDISPDGNLVAFGSEAVLDGPAPGARATGDEEEEEETTTYQQIYVRDRTAGDTMVVSVSGSGELGNGGSALVYGPTLSADAQQVAFESDASNLVAEDTNQKTDAFVRDLSAGTTVRVSERTPFEELGAFTPVSPDRLLDTRTTGVPVGAGETVVVQVTGAGGVPVGAVAAALNVTATGATEASHLTVYPADEAAPRASNLNFPAGDTVANATTTKLSADGMVAVRNNSGEVDVIVDVNGWYDGLTVEAGGGFHPTSPARLLDTRTTGLTVGPGETVDLLVAGEGAAPSTATAVALNVTATQPTLPSHLTVYPAGEATPTSSNLNMDAGETIANSVVVKVGTDGMVTIRNNSGETHIVVDLDGWFDGTLPGGGMTPLSPARLLDTRTTATPLAAGEVRDLVVTDVGGVPAGESAGVVLNVTAVDPTADTHLTVFPSGVAAPRASNINVPAGRTLPNQVLVPIGVDGKVSIRNNSGSTQVVVDVFGWVSGVQVAEGGGGPAISLDGAVAAFESTAPTLTDGDANGVVDIFTRTLASSVTERVSVVDETVGGTEATGTRIDGDTGEIVPQKNGADAVIGQDGRMVAFVSNGNLANDRPEGEEEEGEISTEPAVYLRTRY